MNPTPPSEPTTPPKITMPPPLQDPGGRQVGGLTPPGQSSAGRSPTSGNIQSTEYGRDNTLVWIVAAGAVLLILALGVLFLLPDAVKQSPPDSVAGKTAETGVSRPTSKPATSTKKPLAPPSAETKSNAELQHKAGERLDQVLEQRAKLELESANIWAEKDWNALEKDKKKADQALDEGRLEDAIKGYKWISNGYDLITKKRNEYAKQHFLDGAQALKDGDAEAATKAFERAIAAVPDEQAPQIGLKRAAVLDKVLAQMRIAQEAAEAGNTDKQIKALKTAIALDPLHKQAKKQLKAVETQLEETAFELAMSQALNALDQGRLKEARKAINIARKLRPSDPAVASIRQRLAGASRTVQLNRSRKTANKAVQSEHWAAAKKEYEKALKIDATSAFAQRGLTNAKARIKLHEQLDHYLKRPDRIHSPEPLANAERLIASAGKGTAKEPKLAAKISQLKEQVRLAKIPIKVRIRSDGETEVTLLPVAKLGRFDTKTMDLRPGSYTLTGFRNGYVDARRVFKIQPGKRPPPLSIRCEEPID